MSSILNADSRQNELTEEEADRYDRQMRLWGIEAQQRIRNATILVVRLRGVATEAIKNMVLAGIGRLIVVDWEEVTAEDLGAGFFFRDEDVGKNRLDAAKAKIESLNPLVAVEIRTTYSVLEGNELEALLEAVDLVCVTDWDRDDLIRFNEACRRHKKPLYAGGTYGLLGYIFCDLLDHEHLISQGKEGMKTVTQVSYPSLRNALCHRWTGLTRRQTKELNPAIVFTILALWQYQSLHKRLLPSGLECATELHSVVNSLLKEADVNKQVLITVNQDFINSVATTAAHEFSPVCAIVGGILAQDVIKALAGRDAPIANFFTFDGNIGTAGVGCSESLMLSPNPADKRILHTTVPRLTGIVNPDDSPASRTGPPRSLSFAYSLPGSPSQSQSVDHNSVHGYFEDGEIPVFQPLSFRGALEYPDLSQSQAIKGKKRQSRVLDDRLYELHESPKEEKERFDWTNEAKEDSMQCMDTRAGDDAAGSSGLKRTSLMRRVVSDPHGHDSSRTTARKGWGRIQSYFLPSIAHASGRSAAMSHHSVVASSLNIADELSVGGLAPLVLRLWFERDEKGHSFNPLHIQKSVFRIECEYANGARWVVYRDLHDFLSLHVHYTVSNVYHRDIGLNIPDFPRNSIPYLNKLLKKEDARVGRELALRQRAALEDYLIKLMRGVMFLPSANRLASFLELSSLFIYLARSGGHQYKAGYLKIQPATSGSSFGRKSGSRISRKDERWCALRDSYLVFLEDPGETSVWDVFLLDPFFEIQRPKRYYRKGLNLLRPSSSKTTAPLNDASHHQRKRSILTRLIHPFSRTNATSNESDPFQMVLGQVAAIHDLPLQLSTPILDPSTNLNPLGHGQHSADGNSRTKEVSSPDVSKHTFYIVNSQMRLKLRARSERQLLQWVTALQKASNHCPHAGKNRFNSFVPVRLNVAAQWLVDGRDYFWNLSRAILLAKECIYIHDWWLSPELELRRPGKECYRLDRLLERKAREGVKIYIILYQEVFSKTTPTNSNYTKQRLMSLHHNILVQRSPSHIRTGTFYWAHHEKLCVIDQTIVFLGGLDLCFGRWDTSQHALIDDKPEQHIWQGKDYSNPRVRDFVDLHKPLEDMYDRNKVPRMPWHDVGLQIVGQPARDAARHFIQRWNWLLRTKNHSREMPCLLPPPDFKESDLLQQGLTGTCELQLCRSAGPWSMGLHSHIEDSIQTAYIKAIQTSEHFVYIENQFFITSTVINETRIENKIGDAIVDRAIQAHRKKKPWKCCVLIPLLPGFTSPVDNSEASSVRIILECQNRTICRGPYSIYSRLREEGIDPNDYISFFSLRNWGKMRDGTLTTEQVYIHGKVCIVDDRLVIIGSANINERSMRGDRDSEIAAIIRDTNMFNGMMAGKTFKVGRFAHSLRVRLMREHLGIDIDGLHKEIFTANDRVEPETEQEIWDPDSEQRCEQEDTVSHIKVSKLRDQAKDNVPDTVEQASLAAEENGMSNTARTLHQIGLNPKSASQTGNKFLSEERKDSKEKKLLDCSSSAGTLEEKAVLEQNRPEDGILNQCSFTKPPTTTVNGDNIGGAKEIAQLEQSKTGEEFSGAPTNAEGLKITGQSSDQSLSRSAEASSCRVRSILRRDSNKSSTKTWAPPTRKPLVEPHVFEDPIVDPFWKDIWVASAIHNTEIYRKVFHTVPDDLVTTWKQYKDFISHHERTQKLFKDIPNEGRSTLNSDEENCDSQIVTRNSTCIEWKGTHRSKEAIDIQGTTFSRPTKRPEPSDRLEREEVEKLLGELNGHLVVYPTKFLEAEDVANNFLFNADRLLPLPIYS